LGWLVVSVILTALLLGSADGSQPAIYGAAAVGAVAVAWLAAGRLRGGDRRVGMLFALAITVSFLGDFASLSIGWQTGNEPEASVADLGWLGSYAALAAGLLLLLGRGERHQRRDIDGLIDVAAVSVAGMMLIWELAVAATLADASLPVGVRVLWGLYPVLDLAMLALVLRVLIRDRTVAAVLVTGGVSLWLAGDFGYLAIADADSYSVLLDAAWLWGMILLALAVISGPSTPLRRWTRPPKPAATEVGLGRIVMGLLPLLVPGWIELQGFLEGEDPNPTVTIAGTVVLVALALLRMARLAWSARAARDALASQERYASALAANSADAVVVVDAGLRFVADFPRLATLVGHTGCNIRGRNLLELVIPEDHEDARAALRRAMASPRQVFSRELRIRHGSGRQIWLAARVVNLLVDPDINGVVVNLHDVTDRKRAEEELGHQAFHDALTGLANRALFRDRLDHALESSSRTGTAPAVIFLDLDGFKTVNDSLGHDVGDDLLREVATRLAGTVRRGDTVGRLGGDEFAILIEQSGRPMAEATTEAERVLHALREPVQLGERSLSVSASLGIAVGDHLSDSASLLRDADVAMYRSKMTGKDRWTAYQPEMRTAALERMELQAGMQMALERGEFRLVYQPIIELPTDRVVGFEALLRWHHPTFGLLTPERFIPLAEETGLIVPIGRWALDEATRTGARWQHRLPIGDKLIMAVNLSARQLAAPSLVDDVTRALTSSGFDLDRLVLEVTETALVHDAAAAAVRLQRLHRLGVRLAIDDFGAGYSSLSYLRHFPVDILKIDRTFVDTIPEHGEFPPILRGLLELGRTLQFRTIAEGVELDFQRTRLRDEQCDLAQGFLFARPMSRTRAEEYLSQFQATPVTWTGPPELVPDGGRRAGAG
jgi:diguanylate cyclase (GGDEF)-like protein/PAS domain S-box-containing protein